jgi:hypothetical protein
MGNNLDAKEALFALHRRERAVQHSSERLVLPVTRRLGQRRQVG